MLRTLPLVMLEYVNDSYGFAGVRSNGQDLQGLLFFLFLKNSNLRFFFFFFFFFFVFFTFYFLANVHVLILLLLLLLVFFFFFFVRSLGLLTMKQAYWFSFFFSI